MNYKELPKKPGVYLFKNQDDEIIYVGKAKNLNKRVSSYFTKDHTDSIKTKHLVSKIKDIDFIVVDNEVEALLLENKLIKKNTPKYNINLKDSKTYAYIKITNDKYPKVISTRKVTKDGIYFGPYVNGFLRKDLVDLTNKLFKLRVCDTLPKRECLNYHIGLCSAPCINNVSKDEYQNQVNSAKEFLNGNSSNIVKILKSEMQNAASEQKYEIALENKRYLDSIDLIEQRQKVDRLSNYDEDVIAIKNEDNYSKIFLFNINRGTIVKKQEFKFEYSETILEDFIKLYYSQNYIPQEIIISCKLSSDDEKKNIEDYLTLIRGKKVSIIVPQKGEKKELIKMAEKNLEYIKDNNALEEIKEKLTLANVPEVIECFDISNLSYEHIVAGMTRWVNGMPQKEGYRRFEIRSVKGKNDDFASMKEVIYRRYNKLKSENERLPDLIIIDGGPGQLNSALFSLKMLGLKIPIIGLAKKDEEIYLPEIKEPMQFDKNSKMMLLIRRIRDSVHNYVLGYNKKKREMKLKNSFENKDLVR